MSINGVEVGRGRLLLGVVGLVALVSVTPAAAVDAEPAVFGWGTGGLEAYLPESDVVRSVVAPDIDTEMVLKEAAPDGQHLLVTYDGRPALLDPDGDLQWLADQLYDSVWNYVPAWTSDSSEVAFPLFGPGPGLYLADVANGSLEQLFDITFEGRRGTLRAFDLSPDGRYAAIIGSSEEFGNGVRILDRSDGTRLEYDPYSYSELGLQQEWLEELSWAPQGGKLLLRDGIRRLVAFDVATKSSEVVREIEDEGVTLAGGGQIPWSPDGRTMAYLVWVDDLDPLTPSTLHVEFLDTDGQVQRSDAIPPMVDTRTTYLAWVTDDLLIASTWEGLVSVTRAGAVSVLTSGFGEGMVFTRSASPDWFALADAPGTDEPDPAPAPAPEPEPAPEPVPVRSLELVCPEPATTSDFIDVEDGNVHLPAIECAAAWSLTGGVGDDRFDPHRTVTRGQMATFITRTLEASGRTPDSATIDQTPFTDIAGTTHESSIARLYVAGIVSGQDADSYGPDAPVTRAQMATFLANAYRYRFSESLPLNPEVDFSDIAGSTHEESIRRVAGAGLTGGTGGGLYSPDEWVRRDQMTSFITRLLDLALEEAA